MTRVAVVGAGIVGLCTAAALRARGAEVIVVDHGPVGGGAARGNAGWICPSQLGSLASPHALREAVRNVGRPLAPVYVRPAGALRLAPWFARFVRAATPARAAAGRAALVALDRASGPALAELATAGAALDGPHGIVLVLPTRSAAQAAAAAYGVDDVVTGDALAALAPLLAAPGRHHGALLPRDRSIDPGAFVDSLEALLRADGVAFRTGAPVAGVDATAGRVRALVAGGERIEAEWFVLAAGAGTASLARRFGLRLPLVGGKGYSFTVMPAAPVPHAMLLEEEHVAVTPMPWGLRIAGTMELGGREGALDGRRVAGIVGSARRTLTGVDLDARRDVWVGPRPVTADGLPVVGRPQAWPNLLLGAGHGMYGVTLGPATARVLAEIITEGRTTTDIAALSPDRF